MNEKQVLTFFTKEQIEKITKGLVDISKIVSDLIPVFTEAFNNAIEGGRAEELLALLQKDKEQNDE